MNETKKENKSIKTISTITEIVKESYSSFVERVIGLGWIKVATTDCDYTEIWARHGYDGFQILRATVAHCNEPNTYTTYREVCECTITDYEYKTTIKVKDIRERIFYSKPQSAWDNGVKEYAIEILNDVLKRKGEDFEICHDMASEKELLDGNDGWGNYSWSGCCPMDREDITKRLCTPSELKENNNGAIRPNDHERWHDVQGRALAEAANLIFKICDGE